MELIEELIEKRGEVMEPISLSDLCLGLGGFQAVAEHLLRSREEWKASAKRLEAEVDRLQGVISR